MKTDSGSFVSTEDIGAQILPSDLAASQVLDPRPVLRIQEDLIRDPVGDGLLTQSANPQELTKAVGELRLAANDGDCPLQGPNVLRFPHGDA